MYTPDLPCALTVTPFGPKYRNPRTEAHVLFLDRDLFVHTHTTQTHTEWSDQCNRSRLVASRPRGARGGEYRAYLVGRHLDHGNVVRVTLMCTCCLIHLDDPDVYTRTALCSHGDPCRTQVP